MPRFPDYVAQEGLDVPSAPQIEANTAVGKSLTSLGHTLDEAGQRLAERQRQQDAFDDQIAYQRYTLGQDQALQQAQAGMAPEATGFHDAVMAGRAQADGDFLQTVSPANRDRYAGLLALDRDRTSFAAARMEFEGRGAYEQAAFGQSAAAMADQVRASPNLLPSALNALKAQQANQSSVLPAAREAQWLATKQALQTAGWHGRYGDDPSGQGLAALGVKLSPEDQAALPLLMDEGPVDPSVDALTPAQRQQLALQWQTNQTQKQAAARADLAGLQQRLDDMMLTGTLDGPPPDRQTFVTAYGPDEGARSFDEAGAFLKDAPAITALLHQPDGAQDAALRQYAAATAPDGQRFYRNATTAVVRYRAERAADPVGTLGKLYPGLAQQWAALDNADPATLRQALPGLVGQTAALMDAAGVPAGRRRYLPKAMASTIVQAFGDTTKPMADRIGPLRDTIAAVQDPGQRYTLFRQLVDGGIPRLLEPAVAAYARGNNASAGRLFAAVVSDPGQSDGAGATAPTSPVALDNAPGMPAAPRLGAGTDIDLTASAANQFARIASTNGIDPSPIAQALFPRLVRNNLRTNGGDLTAAIALATADLRKPGGATGPVRYAFLAPTNKGGPGNFGILVPKSQAPTVPAVPPVPSSEAPVGDDPARPRSTGRLGYVGMPEEPLVRMSLSDFLSRITKRGGLGDAADLIAAELFSALALPSGMSEPYQGTLIPKSYSLWPFGGTDVSPAVSSYIWKEATKAPTDGVDPRIVERFRAELFGDFNSDINAARRAMPDQAGPEDYRQYYSGGDYDFRFAPPPQPGGNAVVVALRTSAGWLSPAGPWWGDPDASPRSQPAASATTSPTTPTATADDPPARQSIQIPPSHGVDDPYDHADYQAARHAGLSHEAAVSQAKQNYREETQTDSENTEKNKKGTISYTVTEFHKRNATGENDDEDNEDNKTETDDPNDPPESAKLQAASPNQNQTIVVRLKYKAGWTEDQRAAARAKVGLLNAATTVVTRFVGKRDKTLRGRLLKKLGLLSTDYDMDHGQDLQAGGLDDINNVWFLDRSVNRSLGSQIKHQTKNLSVGTVIHHFTIEDVDENSTSE